jgi:hypothetical protein
MIKVLNFNEDESKLFHYLVSNLSKKRTKKNWEYLDFNSKELGELVYKVHKRKTT